MMDYRQKSLNLFGVLNVPVSKVGLQGASVMSGIGKCEAAGVTQHVRMRLEVEAGSRPSPLNQLGEAGSRERRGALAHEHER